MTINIELPPPTDTQLKAEADRAGVDMEELAGRILAEHFATSPSLPIDDWEARLFAIAIPGTPLPPNTNVREIIYEQ